MKRRISVSRLKEGLLRSAKAVFFGKQKYSCYAIEDRCGPAVASKYLVHMRCRNDGSLLVIDVEAGAYDAGVSLQEFRVMLILMFREAIADL